MTSSEIQQIENKKRSLKRYKKTLGVINRLEDKLARLEDRLTSVRSGNTSGMPRGGTPVTVADLIAEKIELEERITRLRDKASALRSDTLNEIDTLEDVRYAAILESFFIDCETIEDIADLEGYGVRHVLRLYSEAVTTLALK